MSAQKPKLADDWVFFPNQIKIKGRPASLARQGVLVQLHELQRQGKTLVNVNQCQAIREAQKQDGFVLSLAKDWECQLYAKAHQTDIRLRAYYQSVTSRDSYARHTRSQVHNLGSNRPVLVNIAEVHPEEDVVLSYESKVIPVPWLPKGSGYIQKLDEETGLPKEVSSEPNPAFDNAYFYINPELDILSAICSMSGSGPLLSLRRVPSFVNDRLGVRLAKILPQRTLEKRVA